METTNKLRMRSLQAFEVFARGVPPFFTALSRNAVGKDTRCAGTQDHCHHEGFGIEGWLLALAGKIQRVTYADRDHDEDRGGLPPRRLITEFAGKRHVRNPGNEKPGDAGPDK
jgi:hypothetical protein